MAAGFRAMRMTAASAPSRARSLSVRGVTPEQQPAAVSEVRARAHDNEGVPCSSDDSDHDAADVTEVRASSRVRGGLSSGEEGSEEGTRDGDDTPALQPDQLDSATFRWPPVMALNNFEGVLIPVRADRTGVTMVETDFGVCMYQDAPRFTVADLEFIKERSGMDLDADTLLGERPHRVSRERASTEQKLLFTYWSARDFTSRLVATLQLLKTFVDSTRSLERAEAIVRSRELPPKSQDVQDSLRRFEEANKILEAALHDAQSSREAAEARVRTLEGTRDRLQITLDETTSELCGVEIRRDELHDQLAECVSKVERLEQELAHVHTVPLQSSASLMNFLSTNALVHGHRKRLADMLDHYSRGDRNRLVATNTIINITALDAVATGIPLEHPPPSNTSPDDWYPGSNPRDATVDSSGAAMLSSGKSRRAPPASSGGNGGSDRSVSSSKSKRSKTSRQSSLRSSAPSTGLSSSGGSTAPPSSRGLMTFGERLTLARADENDLRSSGLQLSNAPGSVSHKRKGHPPASPDVTVGYEFGGNPSDSDIETEINERGSNAVSDFCRVADGSRRLERDSGDHRFAEEPGNTSVADRSRRGSPSSKSLTHHITSALSQVPPKSKRQKRNSPESKYVSVAGRELTVSGRKLSFYTNQTPGFPDYYFTNVAIKSAQGRCTAEEYLELLASRPWAKMFDNRVKDTFFFSAGDPMVASLAPLVWNFMFENQRAYWELYHWLPIVQTAERLSVYTLRANRRALLTQRFAALEKRLRREYSGYETEKDRFWLEPAFWFPCRQLCWWFLPVQPDQPPQSRPSLGDYLEEIDTEEPVRTGFSTDAVGMPKFLELLDLDYAKELAPKLSAVRDGSYQCPVMGGWAWSPPPVTSPETEIDKKVFDISGQLWEGISWGSRVASERERLPPEYRGEVESSSNDASASTIASPSSPIVISGEVDVATRRLHDGTATLASI